MKLSSKNKINRSSHLDWLTIRLIIGQSIRSVNIGWGVYILWGLGMGIVMILLRNTLNVIDTGYATVLFEPMIYPLITISVLVGLFVSFQVGLSIARERELGTLETLFYGPINYQEYIMGKVLGYSSVYVFVLLAYLLGFALLSTLSHLRFSPFLLLIAFHSLFVSFGLVGLGALTAALVRSVRGALLLLAGLFSLMLGLPFVAGLLTGIVSNREFLELIFLRDTLEFMARFISFLSPVAYLLNGTDAIIRQSHVEYILYFGGALIFGLVVSFLAAQLLRQKGIVR